MTERVSFDELPDWAREIAQSVSVPVTPHVRDHLGQPAWPLFVEAATVGAFLPRELVPALAGSERRDAEKSVLRFAELTQGPDGARWSLTREARTAVLACSNAQEITQAVERTGRFNDPITIALRESLQTANRRELRTLSIPELEAVRVAVTWLRDLENLGLPSLQELDRVISFKRLLEPFRRMVGQKAADDAASSPARPDRFFGRTEEMEDLRAYVGVVAADRIGHRVKRAAKFVQRLITGRQPKVVWGSGGSGKTTLIAKFMLEHGESAESRFPFAYIDFDRSTVSARNRAALLAEMCRQVSCQFELLTEPMTELRNQFADLALRIDVSADADSISLLIPLAQQFRKLIDDAFESSQPFLLVFDTFEIVQYGPDQVIALEKLVSAIAGGAANSWPRLRLIIAGRQKVPLFLGSVEERELGALDKEGSAEMLEAMAADAGKPITREDATKLVEVIAKHVRDKSNTGVRPLRLRLIGQLFSDHDESGPNVVQGLLADLNKPASEQGLVGRVLVDGILVRRILNHVKDPRVRALADPGLVVRRITPDVIRDVMTRGTAMPDGSGIEPADSETIEPWIVTDDEAQDIFAAFGRDLNLVDPDGSAYRHRQDVRQDMLPLIQIRRPFGFQRVHGLAYEFFRKRALADPNDFASAGEAIYHGLWLRLPCEQIEELWPKAPTFDPRIDPDEFELGTLENIYLRARKKGRLTPDEIAMLPPEIAVEWLGSRAEELLAQQRLDEGIAEVRAVGGTDYAAFDNRRDVAATAARLLYRAGLWNDAAALLKRHVRAKLQIRRGDVVSLVRTWATILAKSGAEAEQLAALLPTAQAIQDPIIRTEILAHIALGLDDSHEWTRTRESARAAAMRSAFDVRPSMWARETRTLRLVLSTRAEGFERLVGTYLETCVRLPQDRSAVAFLSAQRQGQPVALEEVNVIWQMNRRRTFANFPRPEPAQVRAIAAADHSDWIVPFGNAVTREFDMHKKVMQSIRSAASKTTSASFVEHAFTSKDALSLFEAVGEVGMLHAASLLRPRDSKPLFPSNSVDMAMALLRWHSITTGEPLAKAPEIVELPLVKVLEGSDLDLMSSRLLAYTAHRLHEFDRDEVNRTIELAVTRVAERSPIVPVGTSLFPIFAAEVERTIQIRSRNVTFATTRDIPIEKQIAAADWGDLTPRLLAYTRMRLSRHGAAALGYGKDPSDYVQQAVVLLLEGTRAPSGNRTLFQFLCGVVDSLISHEAERSRMRGPHYAISIGTEDVYVSSEIREERLPSGESFERRLLAKDEMERFLQSIEPDLARYARLRMAKPGATADEYAHDLNVTVAEVRNMDKRLKRRREQWFPR
jgi:hypothetical protein